VQKRTALQGDIKRGPAQAGEGRKKKKKDQKKKRSELIGEHNLRRFRVETEKTRCKKREGEPPRGEQR